MPEPLVVVNCKTYSTASGVAAEARNSDDGFGDLR